uniref:Uncharacterized protein n=1 Tax=Leersia perrieri TaxID=77586 RepID=A0A0D9WNG9_9ORYZ
MPSLRSNPTPLPGRLAHHQIALQHPQTHVSIEAGGPHFSPLSHPLASFSSISLARCSRFLHKNHPTHSTLRRRLRSSPQSNRNQNQNQNPHPLLLEAERKHCVVDSSSPLALAAASSLPPGCELKVVFVE